MSEDPYEKIVTWGDVYKQTVGLAEEAEVQEDGDWGEEGVCTYGEGYKDQTIYSCRTCAEIVGHPVGVCYGCYLECHLGHDSVVELFTRRQFRCDCPTLSSTICECRLFKGEPVEPQSNLLNKYNHNFEDVFCWCKRGYSADSNATLIHCLLCEDWFHPECIKNDPNFKHPLDDDDNVFVCHPCLIKTPILLNYPHLLVSLDQQTGDINSTPLEKSQLQQGKKENEHCIMPKEGRKIETHALFQVGWNTKICRCEECKKALEANDLVFLLEDDDDLAPAESSPIDIESNDNEEPPANMTLAEAVRRSESKKRKRSDSNFDPLTAGMEAFSALPHHEAKSNVIHAYDAFAKQLEGFFKKAADEGKVLTTKDIHAFFEELKKAKRR